MQVTIDVEQLRSEVQEKYAGVALTPEGGFHFHTGQHLVEILDYPKEAVSRLPESAVESFAGVGNIWALGPIEPGCPPRGRWMSSSMD